MRLLFTRKHRDNGQSHDLQLQRAFEEQAVTMRRLQALENEARVITRQRPLGWRPSDG